MTPITHWNLIKPSINERVRIGEYILVGIILFTAQLLIFVLTLTNFIK